MPNHDPRAIANIFIAKNGGRLLQTKLQKLVYLAHSWNLSIYNEHLVSGHIEAWDSGPIIRSIWNHLLDFGYNAVGSLLGTHYNSPFVADLSPNERELINRVWRRYGHYSSTQLSAITNGIGSPWGKTYFGFGPTSVISSNDIRKHFIKLALAGRNIPS